MKKHNPLMQSTQRVFAVAIPSIVFLAAGAGALEWSMPGIKLRNFSRITTQSGGEQRRDVIEKDQVDTTAPLPSGHWSFSAHPFLGQGYESRLVVVYSVTADATKGLTITKVGLRNNASKGVSAVKLGWYLSTEEDPNSILIEGRTPLIALPNGLPIGQRQFLAFPVVTFAKIIKRLSMREVVGNFRMEVDVSEIVYEDGSVETGNNMRFIKVASGYPTKNLGRIAGEPCSRRMQLSWI